MNMSLEILSTASFEADLRRIVEIQRDIAFKSDHKTQASMQGEVEHRILEIRRRYQNLYKDWLAYREGRK